MQNDLKHELHHIISGKSQVSYGALIQTIASYLDSGSQTSDEIESSKQIREQETKKLESFVSEQNLWIKDIDFSQYVSEGAEQKVYLKDSDHVLKLNDAIYYSYWTDYFLQSSTSQLLFSRHCIRTYRIYKRKWKAVRCSKTIICDNNPRNRLKQGKVIS